MALPQNLFIEYSKAASNVGPIEEIGSESGQDGSLLVVSWKRTQDSLFKNYEIKIKSSSDGSNNWGKLSYNEITNADETYLAFKFPRTKIKILPDKTQGLELVADTHKFQWSATEALTDKQPNPGGKNIIHFIKWDNNELAYCRNDKRFILANSQDLLKNILTAPDYKSYNDYNILIDTDVLDNNFLNLQEKLWLKGEIKRGKLIIQGKMGD